MPRWSCAAWRWPRVRVRRSASARWTRWRETIAGLGLDPLPITDPATLDGGDVMAVGETVYVGVGGRTNTEGARQLGRALAPVGMTVVPVPLSRVLHLKSAVTALPDGTVIGWTAALDDPSRLPSLSRGPRGGRGSRREAGGGALLMAEGAPRTAALLERRGLRTVSVDIGEFEKLEGCVTCLSVRVRST